MKALVDHGPAGQSAWESAPDPVIGAPTDAIVRITSSTTSKRLWLPRTPVQFVVGVILLWLGVAIVRAGNTGLGVVLLVLGVGLAAVSVPQSIAWGKTRRK